MFGAMRLLKWVSGCGVFLLIACGATKNKSGNTTTSSGDDAGGTGNDTTSTGDDESSTNGGSAGAAVTASTSSGAAGPTTMGSTTSVDSGGSASTGGASGGTGGTGGTTGSDPNPRPDPATATEFEACIYYYRAQCNKRFRECYGADPVAEACPDFDYLCPDALFSDGSPYTVADAIACADLWKAADCSSIIKNEWPDCGLPDPEREPGQPCTFSSQCASRGCATNIPHPDLPACGTCASVVGEGEDCTGSAQVCDEGLECTGTGCQVSIEFGLPEGAECERYAQCAPPNYCFTFPGQETATCQPDPELGEPCAEDVARCVPEGYCSNETGLCEPDVALGDPCSGLTECPGDALCEEGICVPAHALGEPCTPFQRTFTRGDCAPGTLCMCSDDTCSAGTCVLRRDAGEACDEANVVCIPGTECQDGICAITGFQGLADACPAQP